MIRRHSAYSIRDRGESLTKNPDVWLQSLPSQNHRLKAWQKWAPIPLFLDWEILAGGFKSQSFGNRLWVA
jgi:hypothetical protein